MAFDQFTDIGKFWSAVVAALTLLMIVGAERNSGKVRFSQGRRRIRAQGPLGRRGRHRAWHHLSGLGLGQGLIRNALWHFYQTSATHQLIKNLIFFVFIFSFALLRLWVTVLVLTWGLKQSYLAPARP